MLTQLRLIRRLPQSGCHSFTRFEKLTDKPTFAHCPLLWISVGHEVWISRRALGSSQRNPQRHRRTHKFHSCPNRSKVLDSRQPPLFIGCISSTTSLYLWQSLSSSALITFTLCGASMKKWSRLKAAGQVELDAACKCKTSLSIISRLDERKDLISFRLSSGCIWTF